jgi:DNA polymerase-3 subunit gamma/tau
LSDAAFNALLKTLEEPPPHVLFVLCTTDARAVPATIQSRCQRFDFRRLSVEQLVERLRFICEAEKYEVDDKALELIALRSQGGMRDAISALEQVAVYSGGQINHDAVEAMIGEVSDGQMFALGSMLAERDAPGCFGWVADFVLGGTDIALLASDLARHVRNVYLAALIPDDDRLMEALATTTIKIAQYREQADAFGSSDRLAHVLAVLGDLAVELKSAPNARLALEIAFTRIVRPQSDLTLEALAARVAALEARLQQLAAGGAGGAGVAGAVGVVGAAAASGHAMREGAGAGSAAAAEGGLPSKTNSSAGGFGPQENDGFNAATQGAANTGGAAPAQQADPRASEPAALVGTGETDVLWRKTVEAVKKEKPSLASCLSGSFAVPDTNGKALVVELPSGSGFTRVRLEKQENVAAVQGILQRLAGESLAVRYKVAEDPSGLGRGGEAAWEGERAAATYSSPEEGYFEAAAAENNEGSQPRAHTAPSAAASSSARGAAAANAEVPQDGPSPGASNAPAASDTLAMEDIAAMFEASLGESIAFEEVPGGA